MDWPRSLGQLIFKQTRTSIWDSFPPEATEWMLYGFVFMGPAASLVPDIIWPDWLACFVENPSAPGQIQRISGNDRRICEFLFVVADAPEQLALFGLALDDIAEDRCIRLVLLPSHAAGESGVSRLPAGFSRLAMSQYTNGQTAQLDLMQKIAPALALLGPLVLPGWMAIDLDVSRYLCGGTGMREVLVDGVADLPQIDGARSLFLNKLEDAFAVGFDFGILVLGRRWLQVGGSAMLQRLLLPPRVCLQSIEHLTGCAALLLLSRRVD